MKKKYFIMIAVALISTILLSSCGNSGSSDNKVTYSAQLPYSAQEYSLYLNKEIEPITNQLVTQMMMARNVADGECNAEDAIASAKASLATVEECYASVDVMQPAKDYTELRLNALQTIDRVSATLKTYIAEMEKETPDMEAIRSLAKNMQTEYADLTALFNSNWK